MYRFATAFFLCVCLTKTCIGDLDVEVTPASLSRELQTFEIQDYTSTEEGRDTLKAEFHSILGGQRRPWTVASLPENLNKNRYADLLAFDETRVVLNRLPNDSSSDYINANYIDGFNREKEYVATQGPLPNTINDFWRMIWQLNARKIVMLANLMEHGESKVAKYWPENNASYGDITVSKLAEYSIDSSNHVVRTFSMKRSGKSKRRLVRHFHFVGWPDFGVPSDKLAVVSIMQQARKYRPQDTAPLVVHCSAGVGRTGTTILMDSMIQRAESEDKVDFPKRLDHMRVQRVDVVEKEGQYLFAHEAVYELYYGNGSTEYLQNINNQYNNLDSQNTEEDSEDNTEGTGVTQTPLSRELVTSEIDDYISTEEGVDILKAEYHNIQGGQRRPWTVASLPENLNKNRYDDLLAYDETRVILNLLPNDSHSDYINANYIDGCNRQQEYVATQGPLPNTINDFWRMIWQLDITKIVMLANLMEHGKSKVAKYWPETNALYGDIVVSKMSEYSIENVHHIVRTFLVRKLGESRWRLVRQFHFVGWPDFGVPSDRMAVVSIMLQARKYRPHDTAPLVVHCSAGVGRTGTAILMDSMIQRADKENKVDFPKRLDHMRVQRVDVVEKEGQYLFAHEAVYELYYGNNTADYLANVNNQYNNIDSQTTEGESDGDSDDYPEAVTQPPSDTEMSVNSVEE